MELTHNDINGGIMAGSGVAEAPHGTDTIGAALSVTTARRAEIAERYAEALEEIENAHAEHGRLVAAGAGTEGIRKAIAKLDAEAEGLRRALPLLDADIVELEAEHRAAAIVEAAAERRRTFDIAMAKMAALDASVRAWLDNEFLPALDFANNAMDAAAKAEAHHALLTGQRLRSVSEAFDTIGMALPGAFSRIQSIRNLIPAPHIDAGSDPILFRPTLSTSSIEDKAS